MATSRVIERRLRRAPLRGGKSSRFHVAEKQGLMPTNMRADKKFLPLHVDCHATLPWGSCNGRTISHLDVLRCGISNRPMSAQGVRRGKAALSSGCKSHPATLQPEAVGAAMEVTKWLKPSESVSRIRFRLGYGSILGGFLFFGPGPELI